MKTRLYAPLISLVMAFALLFSVGTTTAHAETQVSKCWRFDGSDTYSYICVAMNFFRDADGLGGTLSQVRIWASGDYGNFESKIEDCDNLRVWNADNEVRWRKDNSECDLYKSNNIKAWYPNVGFHASPTMNLGWTFYPKIDNGPDPGYTHISIKVTF